MSNGPSLSPSRAQDFQRCPLLYRFRTVDRLPESPSPSGAKGTLVHTVLDKLFDLPPVERTRQSAADLLPVAWQNMTQDQADIAAIVAGSPGGIDAWLEEAGNLVESYFEIEDPRRLAPEGREMLVEAALTDGLRLRGYIDRLDVAPGTGALRVVDYKTGKTPKPQYQGSAFFQLRCYALALWRTRGVIPALVQLEYLASREILRAAPTQAELEATEAKLGALWDAIERAARLGQWRASPGSLCDWCAHRGLCPAFGGTTPPPPPDTLARLGIIQSDEPEASGAAAAPVPNAAAQPGSDSARQRLSQAATQPGSDSMTQ